MYHRSHGENMCLAVVDNSESSNTKDGEDETKGHEHSKEEHIRASDSLPVHVR